MSGAYRLERVASLILILSRYLLSCSSAARLRHRSLSLPILQLRSSTGWRHFLHPDLSLFNTYAPNQIKSNRRTMNRPIFLLIFFWEWIESPRAGRAPKWLDDTCPARHFHFCVFGALGRRLEVHACKNHPQVLNTCRCANPTLAPSHLQVNPANRWNICIALPHRAFELN